MKLEPEVEIALDQDFKRKKCIKGQKLLEPGNLSTKLFFIEKGLVRTFYTKNEKDITHYFFPENTFTLPIDSVFYQRPSPYGIEVLEPSIIRWVPFSTIEKHIEKSPNLEKFIRSLLIDVLRGFSDRLSALQFQSAQERYKTLMDNHPDILLRASMGHIASYLGITQQTLSVIRGQK